MEKQLEESLNSFREEREHKYQKKRESHERREKQSLQELQLLAKDLNVANKNTYIDCDEDEFVEDQDDNFICKEIILSNNKGKLTLF